ncbi:MAG: GIY-YIG nuclease family protein [Ignavibacteriae bacterium]|nr:MAG: GIY-YIG nuclease family protein [Ignavibacteriota bacterium]
MENIRRSFSIRIFLADGTPSGLKFVEKSNWIGQGVVCPRPRFSSVKERKEFDRAAVYILLGASDNPDIPLAYIGEADPIRARLEDHHSKKDFWTVAYFFTSKDANLNKAHIQYLEHKLLLLAQDAKRCKLENKNFSTAPSLSEAEQSDIDAFLEEILLCFPVLGITIFEKPEQKPIQRQTLILTNKGIIAEGYESENGFVVKQGATVVEKMVASMNPQALHLRIDLIDNGILKEHTDGYQILSQDYEFSSPSLAATFLLGANINGRDCWKTPSGTTLKQLQEKSEDS